MKNILQRLYLPFGFVFFGLLFAMMIQTALAAIGPDCDPADDIADCTVTPTFTSLQVGDGNVLPEDGDLKIAGGKVYTGGEAGWDFTDILGYELTNLDGGDFISTNDIFVDNAAFIDGWIMSGRYMITTKGGAPSSYTDGDIAATNDLWADVDVTANTGYIRTGLPDSIHGTGSETFDYGPGDIAATDDLWADDDVHVGDQVRANEVLADIIGRFYIRTTHVDVTHSYNEYTTATCDAGDIVVGCSGWIDSAEGRFQGAYPGAGINSCTAVGNSGEGGGMDRRMYAKAICFSPNG